MMNRVVLVGRLTKDPDLKYTANGVAVASFTLAVNRPFTNQQGERETDFINCMVWRKPAENVANFLKKGSLAGVDGRIQTRNYQGQDGKKVYITEVLAESVQFLEPKGEKKDHTKKNFDKEAYEKDQQQKKERFGEDPFSGSGQINIQDDDLPF
jgi:single-strand DNA-binding protein